MQTESYHASAVHSTDETCLHQSSLKIRNLLSENVCRSLQSHLTEVLRDAEHLMHLANLTCFPPLLYATVSSCLFFKLLTSCC